MNKIFKIFLLLLIFFSANSVFSNDIYYCDDYLAKNHINISSSKRNHFRRHRRNNSYNNYPKRIIYNNRNNSPYSVFRNFFNGTITGYTLPVQTSNPFSFSNSYPSSFRTYNNPFNSNLNNNLKTYSYGNGYSYYDNTGQYYNFNNDIDGGMSVKIIKD
ncbi:MAG: hypothetical protein E7Z91_05445 [Cyanobacteria bacterium SIG30]|nr:hypothetical protein [Cyanobacteria bacterium SIG30]